jgi:4-hydroxybenzoate polyprenyltransferase
MIWVATAVALILWLVGVFLRLGQWVNLLLLVAAVLLVYQVIEERRPHGDRAHGRPLGTQPAI